MLYTKAQFKNYIDSDNDSLITLAVDYAEAHGNKKDKFYAYLYQGIVRYLFDDYSKASVSLIRALANADDVEDHYSKGQMYTYLAMGNGALQCSDEDFYAHEAYNEYLTGQLDIFAILTMAVAKQHLEDYDSARYWIDTCIYASREKSIPFVLRNAKATLGTYAFLVGSISLFDSIYQEMEADANYNLTSQSLEYRACYYARINETKLANDYLQRSKELLNEGLSNVVSYWLNASDVYRLLSCEEEYVNSMDSLLYYQDKMLGQAIIHTAFAAQRDYSE